MLQLIERNNNVYLFRFRVPDWNPKQPGTDNGVGRRTEIEAILQFDLAAFTFDVFYARHVVFERFADGTPWLERDGIRIPNDPLTEVAIWQYVHTALLSKIRGQMHWDLPALSYAAQQALAGPVPPGGAM